jgi:hypothetical protein
MKKVLIESPFAGNVARNEYYLKLCLINSICQGEAPFASHLFYTQFLDDTVEEERDVGIKAGLLWGEAADLTAVYIDFGTSTGMQKGIRAAQDVGRPVEYRSIEGLNLGRPSLGYKM